MREVAEQLDGVSDVVDHDAFQEPSEKAGQGERQLARRLDSVDDEPEQRCVAGRDQVLDAVADPLEPLAHVFEGLQPTALLGESAASRLEFLLALEESLSQVGEILLETHAAQRGGLPAPLERGYLAGQTSAMSVENFRCAPSAVVSSPSLS